MPTNKLWIEHTERAAWQSVEALREKLIEAERRLSRMAPPVEGWNELLEAVDAARQEHALPGESYAEWIRSALTGLVEARAKVQSLESELARREVLPVVAAPPQAVRVDGSPRRFGERRPTPDDDDDDDEIGAPSLARAEPRLFQEIRRRYQELSAGRSHFDGETLLLDIATRLDEIPDLDAGEIADAAADLAALSMRLTRGRSSDDEPER
jgi:hypothetical protein